MSEADLRYPRVSQGRRMLGVLIDWLMSYAIAIGFFVEFGDSSMGAVVFLVFTAQYLIFAALGGATPGHRIVGLKIVRFSDGGMPTPLQALIRTSLLIIILTAVTFDQNGRGINERLSNTVLVRTR
jgi:uncharacterized RDD family membrane protein YckC